MKKIVWVLLLQVLLSSLLAEIFPEEPISWTDVQAKYNWKLPPKFPESESVDLFESTLYSEGRLFFQTRDVTKQPSILVWKIKFTDWIKTNWKFTT